MVFMGWKWGDGFGNLLLFVYLKIFGVIYDVVFVLSVWWDFWVFLCFIFVKLKLVILVIKEFVDVFVNCIKILCDFKLWWVMFLLWRYFIFLVICSIMLMDWMIGNGVVVVWVIFIWRRLNKFLFRSFMMI